MDSSHPHRARNVIEKAFEGFIDNIQKNRDPEISKLETHIRTAFIKRDFTKRQQNIMILLYLYSFPFGKEYAFIKNMQDFEICGVSKTKIREELDKLVDLGVIDWRQATHEFAIKDPREWKVPFHSGFSEHRSKELYMENLAHAGIDITEFIKRLES